MKKTGIFLKFAVLALVFAMLLTSAVACNNGAGDGTGDDDGAPNNDQTSSELFDLNGFRIIRAYEADQKMTSKIAALQDKIKTKLGLDLAVAIDLDIEETEGAKEILIGNTDRDATASALSNLKAMTSKEAFVINVTENAVVIVGTTDAATSRAISVFMDDYVNKSSDAGKIRVSNGKTYAALTNSENIEVLAGGTEIEQLVKTTIFTANGTNKTLGYITNATSAHYPRVIELQHQKNPEDNGTLIVHFCLQDTPSVSGQDTRSCFMQSKDGGKTWSLLSRPEEQNPAGKAQGLVPGNMSHLYELPEQLGNFPAGTLVYSSGSINYSVRTEIWVWYSTDAGKTWTQTSLIATGGCVEPNDKWPRQSGVWEPFTWYEDGWLYCFYSDDSDPAHDQKLVYKRSKDGINWSELVDVCKFSDPEARPGMFVMTKMGNGKYFMVYEYINSPGVDKVYYKITDDITSWNPSDPGKPIQAGTYSGGSAPSCLWVPAGGECGTLIATCTWEINGDGTHRIFVSFDYGETWTTMTNPLSYDKSNDKVAAGGSNRIGYSPSFFLAADGRTVYYVNTTNTERGERRIQFASFRIY